MRKPYKNPNKRERCSKSCPRHYLWTSCKEVLYGHLETSGVLYGNHIYTVMLGEKMKPYTIFLFPICILLILTSSCRKTEPTRGTTKVKESVNADNSRPEVLTEPGQYKKRLDLIVAQLAEKTESKYLSEVPEVPENVRHAVNLVEHSIHMRAPVYHCIEYGGFYFMTDQSYRTKNPLDALRSGEPELDDSFIFTHGFAIRKGERSIREFRIGDE